MENVAFEPFLFTIRTESPSYYELSTPSLSPTSRLSTVMSRSYATGVECSGRKSKSAHAAAVAAADEGSSDGTRNWPRSSPEKYSMRHSQRPESGSPKNTV